MLLHSEKSLPCTVDISRELYETVIGESFQIRVKIVVGSESAGDKRSVDSFNLTGFYAEANGGIAAGRIIGVEVRVRGYYPGAVGVRAERGNELRQSGNCSGRISRRCQV